MAHRDDSRTARDLLLAMIALERGWVDGRRLREAFEAWKSSPDRAMGEVLASQGAVDVRGRVVLESLVDEHRSRDGDDGDAGRPGAAIVAEPMAETVAYSGPPRPRPVRVDGAVPPPGAPGFPDRFQIVRPHARGGLGEVFVAVDPELERRVALKELRDHHAHDPMSQARFLLEARLTGRLEHPGIVPVYGLGRYSDGRPYYAMRFIEGETLGLAIERFHRGDDAPRDPDPARREIAFRRLLRSLIDACNAVAYAHSRGVIHRDLKPDNIMLGRFGETLVVDWGLAKMSADGMDDAPEPDVGPALAEEDSPYMTRPGSALGTPQYMSPEQAAGELHRVGPASDVYSLGATLYCLLVGHGPFVDGEVGDVLERVRRGIFPAPRRLRRTIDPALEAICLKAMALDPSQRHPSPTAIAEEIEAWLADVRYRAEQDRAMAEVKRSLARLAVERAGRLLERGMVGEGMLWLARALENLPPDSPGLDRAVRASLGGWHAGPRPVERTLAHRASVRAVAFSPDGRLLVAACDDGLAQLWDVATGARLAAPLGGHDGGIRTVAFSPDGRLAATAGEDGTIRIWDAVTGAFVGGAARYDGSARAVRFSPDGARLAVAGADGAVRLIDVASGAALGEWAVAEPRVVSLAFGTDGRSLIGGGRDGRAWVWNADDGATLAELPHAAGAGSGAMTAGSSLLAELPGVALGPDGRTAASAGADGSARLWDLAAGRSIGEPMTHRGPVDALAFHPEGTLIATACRDGTARLWDAATGLAIGPPLEHRGAVHDIVFSPDGRRLATAGSDGQARCWRVPPPVSGDPERVACWVRVQTEREIDDGDAIRPIDPAVLWELRRRLQELGGPPARAAAHAGERDRAPTIRTGTSRGEPS